MKYTKENDLDHNFPLILEDYLNKILVARHSHNDEKKTIEAINKAEILFIKFKELFNQHGFEGQQKIILKNQNLIKKIQFELDKITEIINTKQDNYSKQIKNISFEISRNKRYLMERQRTFTINNKV